MSGNALSAVGYTYNSLVWAFKSSCSVTLLTDLLIHFERLRSTYSIAVSVNKEIFNFLIIIPFTNLSDFEDFMTIFQNEDKERYQL